MGDFIFICNLPEVLYLARFILGFSAEWRRQALKLDKSPGVTTPSTVGRH